MIAASRFETILPALRTHALIRARGNPDRATALVQQACLVLLERDVRTQTAAQLRSYAKKTITSLAAQGYDDDRDPSPFRPD